MGLSGALGIASNALDVFSTGIQVAGQNIANANTPGYIQEQLNVAAAPGYQAGQLILGSGVQAVGVTQQVNQYLQGEILAANGNTSASSTLNTVYTGLQQQLQALGTNNLSTQMSSFTAALNALANQPNSAALSAQAVDAGTQLASAITSLRSSIDQQRQQANVSVGQLTTQANALITQIAQLNPQITEMESSGLNNSQAGSLRDERDQDLNQLSQILPITYTQNSDGSVSVFTGSNYLVMGQQTQQLQTVDSSSDGVATVNVQLSVSGDQITANSSGSGELIATMQGRDNVLGGFDQNLDTLTSNLISQFNQIYASGQGTEGFTSVTSDNAVSDPTAALNQAGLAFTPQNGTFQVEVTNEITGQTTTSTIDVNLNGTGSDTTLNSLASDLNGVANVSASVTPDGYLQINAASNYQIQFANDSSNTLASLGVNTFFTGNNSTNIGVNSAVTQNPQLFATAQGGGPSDGSNALALTQFASNPNSGLNGQSLNDYYNTTVTNIGNQASAETAMSTSQSDYSQSLTSQQQQISGVSLDQEAIQILQYQKSYQAAAKMVTTIDQMFQTLLQM
ncbi:MAG TPA: flagellar hook-associated protein FlgK [Planctomycetaceae bacterium]|jgi:flagellar hook-associated protein 1 FlgK|nr:flagellar hook-associated protein FlgK [Planctomycetaceae bacterium]